MSPRENVQDMAAMAVVIFVLLLLFLLCCSGGGGGTMTADSALTISKGCDRRPRQLEGPCNRSIVVVRSELRRGEREPAHNAHAPSTSP